MPCGSPKLKRDDIVQRVNQPEMVGKVVSARCNPQTEQWEYSVQFALGQRVVPEEALKPFQGTKSPWEGMSDGTFSGKEAFVCTLTYHRLRHPPARIANSFATARTQFYPHQFKPLLKYLDNPAKSLLIADDVGLGKTIEAGYILRELDARHGRLDRVLIVVPARLQRKWRKEMRDRFNEYFDIVKIGELFHQTELIRKNRVPEQFRWIVSYEGSRSDELTAAIDETQLPIDLLILDESHRVRNTDTKQHRTCAALCFAAESKLFLSATPVMTSLENLWNQLKLLSPSEFQEWPVFDSQMRANRLLIRIQADLATGERGFAEATKLFTEYIEAFTSEAGRTGGFFRSVIERFENPPKDKTGMQRLQSDVAKLSPIGHMISRTRKVEALPNRAIRQAHWVPVTLSPLERGFYDSVEDLCRAVWPNNDDFGFQMSLLMAYRITASCIPAAMDYFADKLANTPVIENPEGDGEEDDTDALFNVTAWNTPETRDRISSILDEYRKAAMPDSKFDNLATILRQVWEDDKKSGRPLRKLVVFSYFRRTIEYLSKELTKREIKNRYIHGLLNVDQREDNIDDFLESKEINVLITSEVGGEGIDLQAACVIINYDLPWNPMVVEQRIGRIDRIGQMSPILYIFNFVVSGSVEETILQRLLERIEIFKESIGELDEIIGPAIQDLTTKALRGELEGREIEQMVQQTGEAISNRLRSAQSMLREVDGLLAADQALIQEINAVAGERQLPSENELLLYLNHFLASRYPGCLLPQKIVKDVVDVDLHGPLAIDIEAKSPELGDEAKLFSNRISTGDVAMTLSREAAYRHPRAELVHLQHPLARFIVNGDSESGQSPAAFSMGVKTNSLKPGRYAFLVALIHVFGQRPISKLVPIFCAMDDRATWNDPETTVPWMLEILDKAQDQKTEALDQEIVSGLQARILGSLDGLKEDWEEREKSIDQARKELHLRTQLASLDYRLKSATDARDRLTRSEAKEFAVRMAQKRMEKAERERQAFLESVPKSIWQPIEHEEIAVGLLTVLAEDRSASAGR